jgi:hypothetical protein
VKESEWQEPLARKDGGEASIDGRPSGDEPASIDEPPSFDEPMLYCPVCSTRLTGRKCKLLCERCGYYMSCADYY